MIQSYNRNCMLKSNQYYWKCVWKKVINNVRSVFVKDVLRRCNCSRKIFETEESFRLWGNRLIFNLWPESVENFQNRQSLPRTSDKCCKAKVCISEKIDCIYRQLVFCDAGFLSLVMSNFSIFRKFIMSGRKTIYRNQIPEMMQLEKVQNKCSISGNRR